MKNAIFVVTGMIAFAAFASTSAKAQEGPRHLPRDASATNQSDIFRLPPDPSRDTTKSINDYNQMLRFGKCASGLGRGALASALATKPQSPDERRLWELNARLTGCGAQPSRVVSLVRGSLSEAMYSRVVKTAPPPAADVDAFLQKQRAYNALREAPDQSLAGATACFAARNPSGVAKVFATSHGSTQEASAMDTLFSETPACGGATRPQSISRSYLRAFLAESLYQYAVDAKGAE